jgi:sugar phosphate isomerase/epimerase
MTKPDLIASYWTIAGGAEPHTDRDWSPFDFQSRVEAAAHAGFTGIGLWHSDIAHILERRTLGEMKRILDSNGIRHVELEFLDGWFKRGDARAQSDRRKRLLLDAAEALEARHIKVGDFEAAPWPMAELIDAFGSLCEEAQAHGTRIVFELMPHSVIGTLDEALALVKGAGAPNGGIIIDLWHMVKLGIPFERLAALPAEYLLGVELNDGYLKGEWDLVTETTCHRKLCGQGEFDVQGFVDAMRRSPYGGPYGVEVLSSELRQWPLERLTKEAFESTMRFFEDAERRAS